MRGHRPPEVLTKIGFTGTSVGCTPIQLAAMTANLRRRNATHIEAHHGDCIGADAQFNELMEEEFADIVIHPPTRDVMRAFCDKRPYVYSKLLLAKPYLVRNKDIVNATDMLFACPGGPEKLRSGTWSTVRYARTLGRHITIFHPDGTITEENQKP